MPELQGFPALYWAENPNVPIPGYLFSVNMDTGNRYRKKIWDKTRNAKTFASEYIANVLLEMKEMYAASVKMTTFVMILNKLLGMSAEDKGGYLSGFQSSDLLTLDDFGMERQTDYVREQVFNIIDGRYLARKPLINTNLSLNDLTRPKDIMEQRIFDRVLEPCVPVCFDSENLRPAQANENCNRTSS